MIMVAELTEAEAVELATVEFIPDNLFNPIQDINGTWIISLQEVEQCSIEWVKELPLIEFVPVDTPLLF
tara:strand:- start:1651 stop:1857 length:207 start_codon:yes stop_codon:yes gene_type:complete